MWVYFGAPESKCTPQPSRTPRRPLPLRPSRPPESLRTDHGAHAAAHPRARLTHPLCTCRFTRLLSHAWYSWNPYSGSSDSPSPQSVWAGAKVGLHQNARLGPSPAGSMEEVSKEGHKPSLLLSYSICKMAEIMHSLCPWS